MLMVIMKDVKGKLIGLEKVAVGTLSDILIHPREVFFPAVRHKASSLILAHNHPSGDPTPSAADLELTRHLIRSGRIMGINLDDHLIVGGDSFVSLKETGLFG
jgi:DNA repair protein RadC